MSEQASNNDMNELRGHLFDTLRGIRDKKEPMDLDRAKAVVDVAQALIGTAKAENDFLRITGQFHASSFIAPSLPAPSTTPGIKGVTTHRLK